MSSQGLQAKYARVIVNVTARALNHPFTYSVPEELAAAVKVGAVVEAPFRTGTLLGFVVSLDDALTEDALGHEIRPLCRVLDDAVFWGGELLELTHFMSRYYGCLWLEALQAAVPAPVLSGVRAALLAKRRFRRAGKRSSGTDAPMLSYPARQLTAQQEAAVQAIDEACSGGPPVLLYGVTGSGKTEVYLQAAARCLQRGRQVMVLVPELSLTHQAMERYRGRLGETVGILHSALSVPERRNCWWALHRGELQAVLGTRSAVFAPLDNLGLIVIDEEHETSYKQENAPRYHARQIAYMRAKHYGAGLVLGSATPSLESFYLAQQQRYRLVTMTERPQGQKLPEVHLIDMRQRGRRSRMISPPLAEAVRQRLAEKQQIVLFLNRRGFSKYLQCNDCGMSVGCPHCSIPLTYHKAKGQMRCHYCGFVSAPPEECPNCGGYSFVHGRGGTERLLNEVAALAPGVKIARLDKDTTGKIGDHERILNEFASGEAQILLGTKMITKGLDYPLVTLVGVINGDEELNMPDFRASERCFQLITQVAGRAGRGHLPGEVYLQVCNPEQLAVQAALKNDYAALYAAEMQLRRALNYPPFCRLVRVVASSTEETAAAAQIGRLAEHLRRLSLSAAVVGPAPCVLERLQGKYRYHVLCKCPSVQPVVEAVSAYLEELSKRGGCAGVNFSIDAEPQSLT